MDERVILGLEKFKEESNHNWLWILENLFNNNVLEENQPSLESLVSICDNSLIDYGFDDEYFDLYITSSIGTIQKTYKKLNKYYIFDNITFHTNFFIDNNIEICQDDIIKFLKDKIFE